MLEDNILDILVFILQQECKNQLLVHGFYPSTQSLNKLVDLCNHLKTSEELFQKQGGKKYQK